MSLYVAKGSPELEISSAELPSLLFEALDKIGERRHVLAVPPDLTRRDSRAGELTQHAYDYYGGRLEAVLPALGTHIAMSSVQLTSMFGKMPHELFRIQLARRRRDAWGSWDNVHSRAIGRQSKLRMAGAGESPDRTRRLRSCALAEDNGSKEKAQILSRLWGHFLPLRTRSQILTI